MPTMVSNLELLRRTPLLSLLTPSQAAAIAHAVDKQSFMRGENLVTQDHRTDRLFILLTGRVRLIATDNYGRQLFLSKLRPGDFLDEMSLIDDLPHTATAVAEAHTDVLTLGRAEFLHCLQENSGLAHAVMTRLVQRLRQANRKIEAFALMDVPGRVKRALVEHAMHTDGGSMVIHEKISRQDIAKMVGASREAVSRVMNDLQTRGLIQMDSQDRITLQDTLLKQLA